MKTITESRKVKQAIASCNVYCYITATIYTKPKAEQDIMVKSQLVATERLHKYMTGLASQGRIQVSPMRQAVQIGGYIVIYLYTIGEGGCNNLDILEVAQFFN